MLSKSRLTVLTRDRRRRSTLSDWLGKLKGDTDVQDFDDETALEYDNDSELWSGDSDNIRQKDRLTTQEQEERKRKELNPDKQIFTEKLWFCTIIAVLSVLNSVTLALEIDLHCRGYGCDPQEHYKWQVVRYVFWSFTVIELMIRIYDAGIQRFFQGVRGRSNVRICGREIRLKLNFLNCLDVVVITLGAVDLFYLAPAADYKPTLYLVTLFRILHFVSCVNHLQFHDSFRELWLVLSALGETMRHMCWVGLMVMFVTWVAAILVTMALSATDPETVILDRSQWTFDDYWGSVLKTLNTLFQFMTRDKWGDALVFPVVLLNRELLIIFLSFYLIAGMALMNAVVGVIIESTLSTSRGKTDRNAQQDRENQHVVVEYLHKIFREFIEDRNGEMTRYELRSLLRKRSVRDLLKVLELPIADLCMLYELLDTASMDGEGVDGCVNCDKFFRGVDRFRGQGRAQDLHQMSIDLVRAHSTYDDDLAMIASINNLLANVLDNIGETEQGVIVDPTDELLDPVTARRKEKGIFKIAEDIRYPFRPAPPKVSYNPWDRFPLKAKAKSELDALGSNPLRSTRPVDATSGVAKTRKVKTRPKALDPYQPPPPTLPHHFRYLKDSIQQRTHNPGLLEIKDGHAH